MGVIYKYALAETDKQTLHLPKGANVLAVQSQRGALTLWAQVDISAVPEPRVFHVIGTGNPMPDVPLIYFDSVQLGPFVWHVFEEVRA